MKSHVSDLLELAILVLRDSEAMCSAPLVDRDILTLTSRVEHEGLSFLTLTLPTLGKDFERCLSLGRIEPGLFRSFRKRLKAPAFLQGFFAQVFDESGRIYDEPSIEAIKCIRQIAYTFKKLKVQCTPSRVRSTFSRFKADEQFVKGFHFSQDITTDFHSVCRVLWRTVFGLGGCNLPVAEMVPKHGPGATADKLSGNSKFRLKRWHERLEPYFPLLHNVFSNENAYGSREFGRVTFVPECDEQPVRVTAVPKTLAGPRIIAIEPVCTQFVQQAISRDLTDLLENHWFTKGHVNFTDQEVNQRLAISSSKDGKFATLDLSSASDLVPYELAISMFDSHPDLQDAISACRSKRAQLPDGDILTLSKFASMGSALCFPVEAMYFYTVCVIALLKKHNLPVTTTNALQVSRGIYVYGDDIIVPTDVADIVMETLHKYCCKVNTTKSFYSGNFRESCGMDAFQGERVTPVYLRETIPHNKRSIPSLISSTATSNQFYLNGFWKTADYLKTKVEDILGKLPIVSETCAGLGWQSYQPRLSYQRWGKRFQRPEVRTWVVSPVYQRDRLNGYAALAKSLLRTGSSCPIRDKKHLVRTARHGASALKRRWVAPA